MLWRRGAVVDQRRTVRFVGAAMPDTKRGRAVQLTLFFGAGVTVGVWDRKRNRARNVLICLGSAVAGAALGYVARPK